MNKFFKKGRDPMSSYTHFVGACLSVIATILLLFIYCYHNGHNAGTVASLMVFGLSLVALYSTSSIYHYINASAEKLVRMRKLDHSMIYVLIAGTYTPLVASFLEPHKATIFLIVIWSIAALGIIMKICWLNAPRWLSTAIYLLMGWALVFDWKAFVGIPTGCLALIAGGGIAYSIGAILYIIKKPNPTPSFGFHEIFHVFVILGSAFHVIAVALYIA